VEVSLFKICAVLAKAKRATLAVRYVWFSFLARRPRIETQRESSLHPPLKESESCLLLLIPMYAKCECVCCSRRSRGASLWTAGAVGDGGRRIDEDATSKFWASEEMES